MEGSVAEEIENIVEYLRTYGAKTVHNLLAAFLIWLFGNLVFIPIASSLFWQIRVIVSLIFFMAFTILLIRTLPTLKKLIDTFSIFPAKKYGIKRGLSLKDSLVLFRHLFYIIFAVIFYLLYFPFLTSFHLAISGIVLILLLIWIFFLTLRILSILSKKIMEWLYT